MYTIFIDVHLLFLTICSFCEKIKLIYVCLQARVSSIGRCQSTAT